MKKSLLNFKEYIVLDVFSGFENVTAKSMFGGFGIYKNGKIFGIIMNDEKFYLKGEGEDAKSFYEQNGGKQAEYKSRGKIMMMKYWSVPEEVLENREELERWMSYIKLSV